MASESIWVKLGLDNTAFNRGLAGATQSVDRLKNSWAKISGAFVVAGLARKAFDMADSIQRLQQTTGLAAETIQTLQLATEQAGGSAEGAERNLKKLAENVGKARIEGGAAAEVFKTLDIALTDSNGAAVSNEVILGKIADRLSSIKDPAERAALATKLFGKGGHEMVAVLAAGSEELAKLRAELEKTGAVMSESTVRELDRLDDAAKRGLKTATNFVGRTIGQVSQLFQVNALILKRYTTDVFRSAEEADAALEAGVDRVLFGEQQMESALAKSTAAVKAKMEAQEKALKTAERALKIDEQRIDTLRKLDEVQLEKDAAMRAPALAGSLEELANADLSRGGTRQAFAQKREAQFIMALEARGAQRRQMGLTALSEQDFATSRFRRQNLTLANEDVRNPLKKFDDQISVLKQQLKVQEDTLRALQRGDTLAPNTTETP